MARFTDLTTRVKESSAFVSGIAEEVHINTKGMFMSLNSDSRNAPTRKVSNTCMLVEAWNAAYAISTEQLEQLISPRAFNSGKMIADIHRGVF